MAGFKLYQVSGYDSPMRLSEEHAEQLGGTEVAETNTVPSKQAPKSDWVAYAVGQGMDYDTANAMTKADLVAQYGGS